MTKIRTNNLKCFYFIIIILHSIENFTFNRKRTIENKVLNPYSTIVLTFLTFEALNSWRIRGNGDCRRSITKH